MKKMVYSLLIGGSILCMGISVYGVVRQYETVGLLKQTYESKEERRNQIEDYLKDLAYYEDLDKLYELQINSYEKYLPYYIYESERFNQLLSFLQDYSLTGLQVTQGEEMEEDKLIRRKTYSMTYTSSLDTSRTLIKDLDGLSGMPKIENLTMNHLDKEQIQTQFDISFKRRLEPFNISGRTNE